MRYNPRHRTQIPTYFFLENERRMLLRNYDFIVCHYKFPNNKRTLICNGKYDQLGVLYEYEIRYDGTIPSVYITNPIIPYSFDCHMFNDGKLCLYYSPEDPWGHNKHLYSHIVPWVHEWILYYEIYKLSGKWEHPSVHPGE